MPRDPYQSFAVHYLGRFTSDPVTGHEGLGSRYNSPKLRRNLLQADLQVRPEDFVAAALLSGLLGLALGIVLSIIVIFEAAAGNIAELWAGLVLFTIPLLWMGGIMVYLAIPSSIASRRAMDIDYKLPYALNFISAMSSANVTPVTVFRGLAKQPVYGEVAREAARIVRDVDVLGTDLITTLHSAIQRSPSLNFQEFLQGIITTITTGGRLKPYFVEKTEELLRENRSDQKRFIDNLGLLAESYVTIVVAAPLFVIIMLSVLMLISRGDTFNVKAEFFAYLIIFFVIPLVQFAYTYLIRTRSHEPPDMPVTGKITTTLKDVSHVFRQYRHPRLMTQEQRDHFYLQTAQMATMILSLAFFVMGLLALTLETFLWLRPQDYLVLVILSLIGPYAFYEWSTLRRIHSIELTVGDFLRDLAESTRAGMTLHAAIRKASHGAYGDLTDEIITMAIQISWGVSAIDALKLFAERVRTPLIARSVALITEASLAGGNVADVLKSAAENTKETQLIARERESAMSIYTSVIYMSFAILVGVLMAIYILFLPAAVEAVEGIDSSDAVFLPDEVNIGFFQLIFTGAALVQGFGGGLVAGVISRGKVLAGFKYSFAMVLVGYLITQLAYAYVGL